MSEVEYLGHRISGQCLQPSQEKVHAIREAPTPKKVEKLSLFGACELLWKIYPKSIYHIEFALQAVEKGSRVEMELRTRSSCQANEEDV